MVQLQDYSVLFNNHAQQYGRFLHVFQQNELLRAKEENKQQHVLHAILFYELEETTCDTGTQSQS